MKSAMSARESVAVPGGRLDYHRRPARQPGVHPPVILLHPWFGCWQFWRSTVAALPEFDTYAVDLYSLGATDRWEDYASPHGLARALAIMLDALGLERCSLVGNSMGGIAGQALAAEEGERIEKLILVGTGARTVGIKPEFRKALDAWIAGEADRAFTESLVDSLIVRRPADAGEFQTFVEMVVGANKAFMGMVLTQAFALDLRPVLPRITASTLVIRGEHDGARTPAHVAEILAGVPNSRAVEIPNAGHSPQVDSPQAFTAIVRDFLTG